MAERKYEKYILTDLRLPANIQAREEEYSKRATRILWLEDEIMEGASSVILSWYWKPTEKEGSPSHVHDFDEIIGFIGSDPENPKDLGGEVEFWLEDEKYLLTKSCLIFAPRGLRHCPLRVTRADRPILFLAFSVTGRYTKEGIIEAVD
ncbi:MAG: hypothetical protein JXA46_14795 [Dehalococcoidales bacterium]|nr:hypothetical protein [Dehalococcoidales bacterium]